MMEGYRIERVTSELPDDLISLESVVPPPDESFRIIRNHDNEPMAVYETRKEAEDAQREAAELNAEYREGEDKLRSHMFLLVGFTKADNGRWACDRDSCVSMVEGLVDEECTRPYSPAPIGPCDHCGRG